MHAAVRDVFPGFSKKFEGEVLHMYCDILGLITVSIGCLADPLALALGMPWRNRDGSLATDEEVARDWNRVKQNADDLKHRHYSHAGALTSVRLDKAGSDALVDSRLRQNAAILRGTFGSFRDFTADAQLAILSMAWACGAGFPAKFPRFTAAVRDGDWIGAAEHCLIRTAGNPGIVPRNAANQLCFRNAATVVAAGMDRSVLHWPSPAIVPTEPPLPSPRLIPLEVDHDELRAGRDAIIREENK